MATPGPAAGRSRAGATRRARRARVASLAALALLAGVAGIASAARFSLNLTRVHLGRAHPVETVALGNEEARPLNFEVAVKRWEQAADGSWTLAPSDGLVVHPLIVTVQPGDKARVRIGTLSPGVATEQAYRVELQQLPDPGAPRDALQIRMLTKISLPVFVQPADGRPALRLELASAGPGQAVARLGNTGTRYAEPAEASWRVLDAGGRVLHTGSLTLGYVLAGGQLPVTLAWPAGTCARAAQLELQPAGGAPLRAPVPAALRRCAP